MNELHIRYKQETGNSPYVGELSVYEREDDDHPELEPDLIVHDFGTDASILSELKTRNLIEIPDQEYVEWLESQLQ